MKRLILSIFLSLQVLIALGQTEGQNRPNDWQEKFFQSSEEVLPILFEAAIKNSAQVEKLDLGKEIALQESKIIRKEIFTNVSLGGTYTYGTSFNLLRFANPGQVFDPEMLGFNAFKLPSSAQYGTGLTVGLPIGQFLTRHNKIKRQELIQKQFFAESKNTEMEIRKVVIGLYQNIVLAKAELELNQEAFQTASVHYKLAEKQLASGEIMLSEMSVIQETYTRAAIAKETAKVKYETTFLYMEELIGMRIKDLLQPL